MAQSLLRRLILNSIEEKGRIKGAPKINFLEKKISVEGEDMVVGQEWLQYWSLISGFYLNLPSDVFGVVIHPDGTSHNMKGGIHEAPSGLYKLQYVDGHERFDFSAPVSEMTTDGEKLTLRVILRYRVINPVLALSIARPVETFLEHIETDIAQYIRTHDHSDIADSADNLEDSKLFSFFSERHERRDPLSRAFSITGIELKDFKGDMEFVEMRRKARKDERQNKIEKDQAEYQQELNRLRAQYKADNEKSIAAHTADLEKKAAEHRAEIEKREAEHKKEKDEILQEVREREIKLDNKRKRLEMRGKDFSQIMDAFSKAFSSGLPVNPNAMKYITDLFAAYKEEMESETESSAPSAEQKPSANENREASARVGDKAEKIKNTILDLLDPKK